jgi:uncharacterized protein YpmS
MISTNLKKKSACWLVCLFILISLSCRFLPGAQPEPYIAEILPDNLEAEVETLLQDIQNQSGSFAFTITEEQMTSYLTQKMSENQEAPAIDDLAVEFQSNQILLKGDVMVENIGIKVPVELGLVAKVDENGMLNFELLSVSVASIALPESVERSLSAAITDLMNSKFANYLSGFRIDTVYISDGLLTISGEKR